MTQVYRTHVVFAVTASFLANVCLADATPDAGQNGSQVPSAQRLFCGVAGGEGGSGNACEAVKLQLAPIQNDHFKRMGNNRKQAFIEWMAPAAMYIQAHTGLPAAVIIAQAAQETGWGTSKNFVQRKAIFGHSCWGRNHSQSGQIRLGNQTLTWRGNCASNRPANEGGKYLDFATREDSILAYAHLLMQKASTARTYGRVRTLVNNARQSDPLGVPDARQTAQSIGSAGYAAGGGYANALNNIIRQNNLERFKRHQCQTCYAAQLRSSGGRSPASLANSGNDGANQ